MTTEEGGAAVTVTVAATFTPTASTLARALRWRYVTALGLLATMTVTAFLATVQALATQDSARWCWEQRQVQARRLLELSAGAQTVLRAQTAAEQQAALQGLPPYLWAPCDDPSSAGAKALVVDTSPTLVRLREHDLPAALALTTPKGAQAGDASPTAQAPDALIPATVLAPLMQPLIDATAFLPAVDAAATEDFQRYADTSTTVAFRTQGLLVTQIALILVLGVAVLAPFAARLSPLTTTGRRSSRPQTVATVVGAVALSVLAWVLLEIWGRNALVLYPSMFFGDERLAMILGMAALTILASVLATRTRRAWWLVPGIPAGIAVIHFAKQAVIDDPDFVTLGALFTVILTALALLPALAVRLTMRPAADTPRRTDRAWRGTLATAAAFAVVMCVAVATPDGNGPHAAPSPLLLAPVVLYLGAAVLATSGLPWRPLVATVLGTGLLALATHAMVTGWCTQEPLWCAGGGAASLTTSGLYAAWLVAAGGLGLATGPLDRRWRVGVGRPAALPDQPVGVAEHTVADVTRIPRQGSPADHQVDTAASE